jgi:hypothetical protein
MKGLVEDRGACGKFDAPMTSGNQRATTLWMIMFVAACGTSHDPAGGGSSGAITELVFGVVGDTRPPIPEDTANYPTPIITKLFQDLAMESPAPEFVIGTGDYMFSFGPTAQAQANIYMGARAGFAGKFYPAMGNHECNSFTNSNCASSPTTNMMVFEQTMLEPIGETQPYYTEAFSATDDSWTAKIVFIACNAWDSTQASWLQSELAKSSTYTFVVRHESVADLTGTPCNDSQATIDANPLTLLIVGHTHSYSHVAANKEIVVGIGGAPLTSGTSYGYTIIARDSDGSLTVTTKDYTDGSMIDSFKIAASGAGA